MKKNMLSNTVLVIIFFLGLMGTWVNCEAGSIHPYYQRRMPRFSYPESFFSSIDGEIDLKNAHTDAYPITNPILKTDLSQYNNYYDARAAAAIRDSVGRDSKPHPPSKVKLLDLQKKYKTVEPFYQLTVKALSYMAYGDYFPHSLYKQKLRDFVSEAISIAKPGYVGTAGPDARGSVGAGDSEGNYDFAQMALLHIAYRYYDELKPEAQKKLIEELLQKGVVHRPNKDDMHTSGGVPGDWRMAGVVEPGFADIPIDILGDSGIKVKDIGETENHILMIATARYLTNQLLYQRDHDFRHDNRRYSLDGGPTNIDLILLLLRNILRGDFSEYNGKNYQQETRWALLNLVTYSYDHEVRLAARIVLDYVSARMATSSNDLRRMVPFRRRNEPKNVHEIDGGFMAVDLLNSSGAEQNAGADPIAAYFALQAGNLRAYAPSWKINNDRGQEVAMEVLSDYRLPPSIHDLFVNDGHRRFFQRLHRKAWDDEAEKSRNCGNMEINASSPSYLITAGSEPCDYAIDPRFAGIVIKPDAQKQQLGVAVPTSFMPTGQSATPNILTRAIDLIQFGSFSDKLDEVANYGVAPDFACGYSIHLPDWVTKNDKNINDDGFLFVVDKGSPPKPNNNSGINFMDHFRPGFFLAIRKEGSFACVEALDTWLHPEVGFEQFKQHVLDFNSNISLKNNVETSYTTFNGNKIHFVIWADGARKNDAKRGARVLDISYGNMDPMDKIGNAEKITDKLVNGTIMNSPTESVVEITNPYLGTKITLDMSDRWHPKRISESGEVEIAGQTSGLWNEAWVDFDWRGPQEGDFFHPFNNLAAAVEHVTDGGVIKIMPGSTHENLLIENKHVKLVAPIGGVNIQ